MLKCDQCDQEKSDVEERACGYCLEIYETVQLEVICDECEQEHCDDI